MANNSSQVKQLKSFQELANKSPQVRQATQFETLAENHSSQQEQRHTGPGKSSWTPQLKNQVIQRNGGDSDEEEESAVAGAVGDVATIASLVPGTGLGEAMESIADLAEGAGGTQEVLDSTQSVLTRLTGAIKGLNTVAGFFGRNIPYVGQATSAAQLAESLITSIPSARAEASEARSDLANPDLEIGRSAEEREQRVEATASASNRAMVEAASQAGGITGIPLADKVASVAATAVSEGPSAAARSTLTGVVSTATTLLGAARQSSQMAHKALVQYRENQERERAEGDYDDLLNRMERGEL